MDCRIADQQRRKLLFARLLDLADGEQDVKANRRFLRAWLSWSDAAYGEPPVSWRNSDGLLEILCDAWQVTARPRSGSFRES